jgi:GAF domain-containing protein
MAEIPRETRVLDAVVSLVDTLLEDFDVVDLLTELTEHCAQLLEVEAAGFLLADPLDQLRLLAATTEQARELELFQLQADEGPCVECYATGQPVSVADLHAAAARWPRFVPAALDAGFASVHAVPMRAAGIVLGALGLFGSDPGELGDADRLVAQTLAHIAWRSCRNTHRRRQRCYRSCAPHSRAASSSSRPRGCCAKPSTSPSRRPSPSCGAMRGPTASI